MSIRFVFGASGVGKSHNIFSEVIERSVEGCADGGLNQNQFLIVVPDQFTMQTQKQLVTMHPRGGIMNIDVVSLNRFCHRILEDNGGDQMPILDDTGKSLILKKVAASLSDELPSLGGNLHKQGYIHEVKSAISEFMQYGLSPDKVGELAGYAGQRGALSYKLADLEKLYRGFLAFIQERYITTEEILDRTARYLDRVDLSRTVIVFDGFTGFTPIQNRFIQELDKYARDIYLTLVMGEGEDPYLVDGEQKLFWLSKKTVAGLVETKGRDKNLDRFLHANAQSPDRFTGSRALRALENNLFRTKQTPFEEEQEDIILLETESRKEEVSQVAHLLTKLIREEKLQYRDIAVIAGSLEDYEPFVESLFMDAGIPYYIDKTRKITLNPMIEYMKSALSVYLRDFSQESVLQFLRSGLNGFTRDEVDAMENYLVETGIRGKSRFGRSFTRKTRSMGDSEEALQKMEELRVRMMEHLAILDGPKEMTGEAHVRKLYDYICHTQMQSKLEEMEQAFAENGDRLRESEYRQIYGYVMKLLEQIHNLLGEEVMDRQEFYEILEAGIDEIKVGTIPQNVDRVLVGDMERTRLSQVKVLFFLGVNEGSIPKSASKGGIISDMDREFLKESGTELAPSPRQQMFIQRLYLYLNLTKPSQKLYLSYARTDSMGKSLRPSYLIKTIGRIFPKVTVRYPGRENPMQKIATPREGLLYLAEDMREYALGVGSEDKLANLRSLLGAYEGSEWQEMTQKLTQAAFYRYESQALPREVARLLYGALIDSNISRMENYAACAYRHFLTYGLELKEREEFTFESVDLGNAFHQVLDVFAGKLQESGYTWFDFPDEFADKIVEEELETFGMNYGAGVLYSTNRDRYQMNRMSRILKRTVQTLRTHMQKGEFTPYAHEMGFQMIHDLRDLQLELTQEEKMRLKGRIDRVDVVEDQDRVYVKIIDYKSGDKQFDLTALYYGLQLQLVVYMDAALQKVKEKKGAKEVIPGALLYYQVKDPIVEDAKTPEEIQEKILKELKTKGIVNADESVIHKLDKEMGQKSTVIPVEYKKDGSFAAAASVMSGEELELISDYATHRIKTFCKEILTGHMEKKPYRRKDEEACTYCKFKGACGFDQNLPGYEKRDINDIDEGEFFNKIREEKESWV